MTEDGDHYSIFFSLFPGPGMHFLSPNLFDLMVGHNTDLKEVEHILPEEIKQMLQELINADNCQKTDKFLSNHCEQLLDFGISNVYKMAKDNKEGLVQIIKKHQIFYRTAGEISQFINGMNDVSQAWEMVKTHAGIFKPIFCFQKEEITGEDFLKLFKINFSETGSNQRQTEDITVYGWEAFLQSVEVGDLDVSYPEILSFVTGADRIPPCGFSKLIDVDFYSDIGRLPSVSTCALQLWLPRVTDPDHVTSLMIRAMKESCGFLKV